jgi:hypothetical protein
LSPAEPFELVALCAAGLAIAVGLLPVRAQQRRLLVRGTAGLAGVAAVAVAPTFEVVLAVLLALALIQSAVDGRRTFVVRLRPIVAAVAILALAVLCARVDGPDVLMRFAAIGIVAGIAAIVGVVPYLHEFDPEEPVSSSAIAWIAFIGPVAATVVLLQAEQLLAPDVGGVFGGTLVALGLINMVWGSVAAWRTEVTASAWRYSFVADWGLAMCGFGLTVVDGRRAALLVLFSIVLCRLPLYLVSREALREGTLMLRPINLVAAAALSGSAPFAGFAARILLLRGATELYWPLALVLVAAMLLWLPGSLRLGRSLGLIRGRQAVGFGIVIALNVLAGLYPLPLLSAAGL